MNPSTMQSLNNAFGIDQAAAPVLVNGELVDTVTGEVVDESVALTEVDAASEEELQAERDAKEDFQESRIALKNVGKEVQKALTRAVDVAVQTDNAKSFEAVAKLASAVVEAHRELQDTHEKRARTRVTNRPPAPAGTKIDQQNNIVFQGTADELLQMIRPERT